MSSSTTVIEANGLRLQVYDWGIRGKPLLLLHGLASTSHMFDLIAPKLSGRAHVIAFDQRGHGLSDKPDDGYDFESIAADATAVLSAFGYDGVPVSLVGHSWGAYTALYLAATQPDRIARAALIDGGVRAIGSLFPTWEIARERMSPPDYAHTSLEDIQHMIREHWLKPIYRPELETLALSIFDTNDPAHVTARLTRERHMQIAHALWKFQPQDYFPLVRCPLLIVNAVSSGETPAPEIEQASALAAQAAPQVEVAWMRDTVHDIPWHRPHELAQLLARWWNENP